MLVVVLPIVVGGRGRAFLCCLRPGDEYQGQRGQTVRSFLKNHPVLLHL
jgi:hypothetical protein